jgi:hypothetical protein
MFAMSQAASITDIRRRENGLVHNSNAYKMPKKIWGQTLCHLCISPIQAYPSPPPPKPTPGLLTIFENYIIISYPTNLRGVLYRKMPRGGPGRGWEHLYLTDALIEHGNYIYIYIYIHIYIYIYILF